MRAMPAQSFFALLSPFWIEDFGISHHAWKNFSSSAFWRLFSSNSCRRDAIVANHSSLAASCSFCDAYWTMHEFMVRRCFRHAQVAEIVRLVAHDAKSRRQFRKTAPKKDFKMYLAYLVSRSHIYSEPFWNRALSLEILEPKKVVEGFGWKGDLVEEVQIWGWPSWWQFTENEIAGYNYPDSIAFPSGLRVYSPFWA